jgi:protein-S-isoprenylcysteine O-methyltransferase
MVAGLTLRYFAIRTLGSFFLNEVAVMPKQSLVTHGIYGSLRHPSETGTVCLAFGGATLLGSQYGLAASTLLLLPFLIWRTRLEDRMLRNHYAMEFGRYAADVPAFLPRVRRTNKS